MTTHPPHNKEIISRRMHYCSQCELTIYPGTEVVRTRQKGKDTIWTHLECFEEENNDE